MKIEVNDYVRTKNGIIFRWSSLCTTDIEDYMEHTGKILFIEDEIKSSQNIIDLIEVGDYVNGEKVTDKFDYLLVFGNADYYKDENEIKSIVTKEAFENMEYKVDDKK